MRKLTKWLALLSLAGCTGFSLTGLKFEDDEGNKVEVEGVEVEAEGAPSATPDAAEG